MLPRRERTLSALGRAAAAQAVHDVIMPQYPGRVSEIEKLERAALEAGGELREIILTDAREHAIRRFSERGTDSALDWHGEVQEIVRSLGGDAALYEMHDRLEEVRRAKSAASVIHSEAGEIAAAYDALVDALSRPRHERVRVWG